MSAVELRDVFRVYSTPEGDAAALQGLTLTVDEGELLAVLGPSGSGKTSLLRILAGVDRPSAGSARVFDVELARLSARARARHRAETIGYVDQRYADALDPDASIAAAVALRLTLEGDRRAASACRGTPRSRRTGRPAHGPSGRALRRRAAARRRLRRARPQAAALARGRADG